MQFENDILHWILFNELDHNYRLINYVVLIGLIDIFNGSNTDMRSQVVIGVNHCVFKDA